MKEVTHRVDEDPPWLSPTQWLFKSIWPQGEIETIFEGMTRYTSKSLGEALRVAQVAAARDLGATRYRIPRRIGPFDLGRGGHGHTIEQNENKSQSKCILPEIASP